MSEWVDIGPGCRMPADCTSVVLDLGSKFRIGASGVAAGMGWVYWEGGQAVFCQPKRWAPLPKEPEPRRITLAVSIGEPVAHIPPNLPGKAWKAECIDWCGLYVKVKMVEVDTPVEGGEDGA